MRAFFILSMIFIFLCTNLLCRLLTFVKSFSSVLFTPEQRKEVGSAQLHCSPLLIVAMKYLIFLYPYGLIRWKT